MDIERLNRHITHENLALRSENSQLKKQMEAKDNMLTNKDGEILRLLNQIASDMVKRSDVDEMIAAAVKEAVDKVNAENERKMKAMAAEYEAVIASLKKTDKGGKKGGKGSAGNRRKPNTETYATKEEAVAALEEAQKKALAMADLAFGGGSERITAEHKPAVDPESEDADDDSRIEKPIEQRGNYGQTEYEPIPRAEEYCQYGEADENDTIHNYFYPEGCDENSTAYGERTHTVWEIPKPKLYKIVNHMMRCRVGGKKVWGQMPETPLGKSHRGVLYNVNMILRKYLCGNAECNTQKSQRYEIGIDISRKTINTSINKIINGLRTRFEERFRWHVLQDSYFFIDETVNDVFTTCDDGHQHLRTRYLWGIRASAIHLVYFIYDKGSKSRKVILNFLKDFIGTIQTDGATMYKIFEKNAKLGITRLSCLVHIRRYFYKALMFEDETGIARWFLERIKLIYIFEKQYKKNRLSVETIEARRKEDILPILGEILQELNKYANNVTGECGTLLMKAIHYAQAEWKGLMRYTTDGRYRPDNNYAEAVMRDLATGRKNFLFSGSDESAKNLAFAYSLTQSCKLCNVNPYDYWEDLLTNSCNPTRTIDSFMPHLWRKQP